MPTVELPQMHAGQVSAYNARQRWNVIQCGRRWGKTTYGQIVAAIEAINGRPVGWFAPTYKYLMEPWRELCRWLGPIAVERNQQERRITLSTGGLIDFWTMDSGDPGRGRKYALAVVDEAGIVRELTSTFQAAIRPTLTDLKGWGLFLGTPKGRREFHQFFQRGEQNEPGWTAMRMPTASNPAIDPSEIEEARRMLPDAVFAQEYLGIPADDGGNPFGIDAIAKCFGGVDRSAPVVVWGVDLAKSQDWTVAIGLSASGHAVQVHRWQGTPWSVTIDRLVSMIGNAPALVDSTGVGDAIVEQLQSRMPNVEGYTFTARSKQQLMEGLAVAVQTQTVRFDDQVVRSEMETFGYEYTASGVRYQAPDGMHDDCVCGLALAVHHLGQNSTPTGVSAVHYARQRVELPDLPKIYEVDTAQQQTEALRRWSLGRP